MHQGNRVRGIFRFWYGESVGAFVLEAVKMVVQDFGAALRTDAYLTPPVSPFLLQLRFCSLAVLGFLDLCALQLAQPLLTLLDIGLWYSLTLLIP